MASETPEGAAPQVVVSLRRLDLEPNLACMASAFLLAVLSAPPLPGAIRPARPRPPRRAMSATHLLALLLLLALPSAAAQDAAVSEEVGSGAASFAPTSSDIVTNNA